jgi:ABC-type Na+ transport system ATPase subunit NatA
MLELEHARKYYTSVGEPVHAVDDVTMTVSAGEFVAVLGRAARGRTRC